MSYKMYDDYLYILSILEEKRAAIEAVVVHSSCVFFLSVSQLTFLLSGEKKEYRTSAAFSNIYIRTRSGNDGCYYVFIFFVKYTLKSVYIDSKKPHKITIRTHGLRIFQFVCGFLAIMLRRTMLGFCEITVLLENYHRQIEIKCRRGEKSNGSMRVGVSHKNVYFRLIYWD